MTSPKIFTKYSSQPSTTQETLPFFDQFYFFGDSLSDPGNVFNASTAVNEIASMFPNLISPDDVPPVSPSVPPYDKQGRITNDGNAEEAIWVDTLATHFGLEKVSSLPDHGQVECSDRKLGSHNLELGLTVEPADRRQGLPANHHSVR